MSTIRRMIWPRHRWRRIAITVVLLLLLPLLCYGWYQSRPAQLTPRIERMLSRLVGARVTLGSAQLAWGPSLILEDLVLAVPDQDPLAGRVFEAGTVVLHVHWWPALTGRLEPTSIGIHSPILYLTEHPATGRYTIQQLDLATGDGLDRTDVPRLLPQSTVEAGEVRFGQVIDGRYRRLGKVEVVGRLTDTADQPDRYTFELTGREAGADRHITLAGEIDLRQLSVDIAVENLAIDTIHDRFLPAAYRRWHTAIRPEGLVRRLSMRLAPDETGSLAPRAVELAIEDMALSLPADLLGLGRSDHEIRMHQAQGVSRLVGGRIHDRFTGRIEGIDYTLVASHGFDTSAPFDLTLATEPFELAGEPDFYFALPPIAKAHHRRFAPSGRFKTTVRVHRREPGGPVSTEGVVQIIDAMARYEKFPYPVRRVTGGAIHFTDTEVTLEGIEAIGHTGARIEVNGRIAPPNDDAEVNVDVRIHDLQISPALIAAMPARHRGIVRSFLDEDRHAALIDAGLLTATDTSADPAVPSFAPGGLVREATVHIHRPPGPDRDYQVTTDIDATGLSLLFTHWPYPMTARSGRLQTGRDGVTITNLILRSPTGATATLNGVVGRPADGAVAPQLHITDIALPIDNLLLASIPPPQDRWARDLHLSGTLTGTGLVHAGQPAATAAPGTPGPIDFDLQLSLTSGTARPYAGSYGLDQITGQLQLSRHGLKVRQLTARHGSTTIAADATVDWSTDPPDLSLNIAAQDILLDRQILDLLPPAHPALPRARALWADHQPTARGDLHLTLNRSPDHNRFDLQLDPKQIALTIRNQPLVFTDITGRLRLQPGHVEIEQLAAATEHGQVRLHGIVSLDRTLTSLGFEARSSRLDTVTRALLPPAATAVLDGLSFDGGYHIRSARLTHQPATDPAAPARTHLEAAVDLHNASARLGVAITELEGNLAIEVETPPDDRLPRLDMTLQATGLKLADRLVEPLSLRLTTSTDRQSIALHDLRGTMYGGLLTGDGLILPGPDGWYAANINLHEVSLEPFVNPAEPVAPPPAPATPEPAGLLPMPLIRRQNTGLLSAGLSITGPLAGPGHREGRGVVEVHDARLFERPLSLALLQAANLSLPQTSSLDRVSCRFVLVNDTVLLDTLRFEAPTVSITGSGTLDYPTGKLDLTMVNRNPQAWQFGPLNDLYNTFKDELVVIRVGGTLEQPETRVESLSRLRQTWDDLFGTRKARPEKRGHLD